MQRDSQAGPWYVIFAAVLWGTSGTAQAFTPGDASPMEIGAARLALGGGVLIIIASLRGAFSRTEKWSLGMTLLAASNIALYQFFFFSGVAATGVVVGTLVAIGSSPIFAGLIGWLFRRERVTWTWLLATCFAILGTALLVTSKGEIRFTTAGLMYALGAGASYALYAHASKDLLEHHHPDAVMAVIFGLGAVLLCPLFFLGDLNWVMEPRGMLVVAHLGVFATALAYVLFARGLQRVYLTRAVTLS
jgi:DME family drug/metabolite transporter